MFTLGQKIHELRKAHKMSQSELAEKVGVSTSYIGFLERDIYGAPGPDKLAKIANALNANIKELFVLAGYETTPDATPHKELIKSTIEELKTIKSDISKLIDKLEKE